MLRRTKIINPLLTPLRRTKISHDPRNTAWSTSETSYGQRLMQSQGWKAGDALGANNRRYKDTDAAKLTIQVKDDNLGLGASLKSKDIANQRTGFDAFQGLLGRLNAKDEAEVRAVEKKLEDKKLAMFAQGKWGGMVFVPGGLLVQTDPYKQKLELDKQRAEREQQNIAQVLETSSGPEANFVTEKEKLKAEKRQRKEERRLKREQKLLNNTEGKEGVEAKTGLPTPDSSSSNETEPIKQSDKTSKKRARSPTTSKQAVPTLTAKPVNGRQLLRGKNILAKRAAFADMKGLDEIFMNRG